MNKFYIAIKRICVFVNLWKYLPSDSKSLLYFNKFLKVLLRNNITQGEWAKYANPQALEYLRVGSYYRNINIKLRSVFSKIIIKDRQSFEQQKEYFASYYKNYAGPKILIISHEFSLTGAPKAALLLAKTLKKIYGKSPIVYSLSDGPIKREFIDNQIELVTNSVPMREKNLKKILSMFDVIVANSWCYRAFDILQQVNVPKIWWCHEIFTCATQYEYVRNLMPALSAFWGGSPCTIDNVASLCRLQNPKLILYGLDRIKLKKQKHDKFTFSLLGSVTPRKGQDIFLEAIQKLPQEVIARSKFYIIGKKEKDTYCQKIIEQAGKGTADIELLPEMPFEKLLGYYALSDVIVVPSREDPMPIVATYSFMFSIPCICSASTGTAQLVENGKNALVFSKENAEELASQMQRLFTDKKLYKEIASAAENVYQEHFDMTAFEDKIKQEMMFVTGENNV